MANYNLWNMKGLDIFLQSLNETERKKYIAGIQPKSCISPLMSWGISSEFFTPSTLLQSQKEDSETLLRLANQFQWKINFSEIINRSYDALVVTDVSQKIIWTNPGFFKMTGYSESYAIGKRPSFLQGKETSTETKVAIREKIQLDKPFIQKILNYKKDQEEYWCQIQIFPIKTNGITTHYLALETEML
ncbi:PAS domain S-box [Aequorivita sublithincola DSM 14238]|uniref:PAS domain S-box n=1 Tax=Aequorivita sublithincola (strain DSM 14238 / LMG 21431 / ACAM 643 / 9-3) TaxID=746697 RepID=I3YZM0_AEQSU|nr:PAS domain-containing protein [Aequorivita sublithincola]AFL82438.1 PAS domain S-box [Aequorivita sublithincola DSM 14238]